MWMAIKGYVGAELYGERRAMCSGWRVMGIEDNVILVSDVRCGGL